MSCGIYKITNLLNGKNYVGQSVNIEHRWERHRYSKDNFAIHKAIQKYGINNFQFSIIEECEQKELNEKEIYWIEKYNSMVPNGYNMIQGGSNGAGFAKGKQVNQYDLFGNLLATYPSAHKADDITGIDYSSICACCRHEQPAASGFQWRYSNDEDLNLVTNGDLRHNKVGVIQYDKEGNRIQRYDSLDQAAKITGIAKATICNVCKGKGHTAGGYRWSYVGEPLIIKPTLYGQGKPVYQYDLNGTFINEFRSISEASRQTGVAAAIITDICKGKKSLTSKYIWEFKNKEN